jgi:acetylornithine deacetylase/succinyl-diaminopimelate desuccinylase-like protein
MNLGAASRAGRRRAALALWAFAGAVLGPSITSAGELSGEVEQAARRNFPEYFELLRHPNVAAVPNDIARNAEFLQRALQKRGFVTRRIDNDVGRPIVLAELDAGPAGLPTVLFYLHYDGQPVAAEQWSQPDPFVPVVKRRADNGDWATVDADALQTLPLDPELRVFARSAADAKAPIMMFLTAIDLLVEQGTQPAFDVKLLLDGEEEIGSPSLPAMVAADREAFRADALVILDGPAHASGRPTLVFGNRGLAQTTLTVFGPRSPLHSGHFGNYVPNPAQRLAALLATMKGDDGRVLIPGYYDGVDLTTAERATLAAVDDDEEALRERAGIARPEQVGGNYQEALQYPSLNVRGLAAAGIGDAAANIIPSQAVAEIDLRTTPENDGRRLFELVERHIERQGYHLVDGGPTDDERERHDKLASFVLGSVQAGVRMSMDSSVGRWALTALRSPAAPAPDEDPVRIRMMGGTVPTDVLVEALDAPFVLVPTVNADNNQHAADENLRIGHFLTGTETIYSLLTTRFEPDDATPNRGANGRADESQ